MFNSSTLVFIFVFQIITQSYGLMSVMSFNFFSLLLSILLIVPVLYLWHLVAAVLMMFLFVLFSYFSLLHVLIYWDLMLAMLAVLFYFFPFSIPGYRIFLSILKNKTHLGFKNSLKLYLSLFLHFWRVALGGTVILVGRFRFIGWVAQSPGPCWLGG